MSTTSSLQLDKGAESVTHVELSLITVDTDIQPRDVLSQDDVDRYAEHLDELPPVVVFFDGKTRWLSSGFHRYAAHEMRGKTLIACEVRDGSREDAYLFARGANAEHEKSGRPLTPKEKRRVIGEVLRVVPEWSDSRIAEHVGSSHPTVGKVRAEVVNFTTSQEEAERLDPPVRIGKDGKEQPAKKHRKKKAPPAEAKQAEPAPSSPPGESPPSSGPRPVPLAPAEADDIDDEADELPVTDDLWDDEDESDADELTAKLFAVVQEVAEQWPEGAPRVALHKALLDAGAPFAPEECEADRSPDEVAADLTMKLFDVVDDLIVDWPPGHPVDEVVAHMKQLTRQIEAEAGK